MADEPEAAYDEREKRIAKEQGECPYFENFGIIWDQDSMWCWYDMEPCRDHSRCPIGKW